ncbi:hypothetical protein COV93_07995 [Candidatus Woesearchaeota archaeon CG11_big_fil_rev_8_21_14_0_20_43_8]|nr:MAG: hypothetical protein COV93_07995 [Candidatus Woesearchaeota archaeon CG11_big_fil_rev_8_21_14_0_20_43_8]PIO05575.1 MAG: hypothetical protein COT47_04180 [Candidatus Woesearchaeota archaeon CG08_land_8_20_14_0_20_43_7]
MAYARPPENDPKETSRALERFIQHLYWGDDLDTDQARENLDHGLVEIIYNDGGHCANGLLVTQNGYFLTPKHCIEDDTATKLVKLHDGKIYAIEEICEIAGDDDIALAKAPIQGKCRPAKYRLFNYDPQRGMPLALKSRENGELVTNYGFFQRAWDTGSTLERGGYKSQNREQFEMTMLTAKGNSGSVIIGQEAELIGFLKGTDRQHNTSTGVKLMKALELVSLYSQRLRKM